MDNPINVIKNAYSSHTTEKKEKRVTELKAEAIKQAVKDYTIERIDNVNYITHLGIPVSTSADAESSDLIARLQSYRDQYVASCERAGALLLHN